LLSTEYYYKLCFICKERSKLWGDWKIIIHYFSQLFFYSCMVVKTFYENINWPYFCNLCLCCHFIQSIRFGFYLPFLGEIRFRTVCPLVTNVIILTSCSTRVFIKTIYNISLLLTQKQMFLWNLIQKGFTNGSIILSLRYANSYKQACVACTKFIMK
jgi:hypothetical protein